MRGMTLAAGLILAFLMAGAPRRVPPGRGPEPPAGTRAPEPPRLYVETSPVPATGRTLAVPSGGDFQGALDSARPGDVITLEAGAVFRGPFTLPQKSGADWIVIRTSASDAELPPAGTRIDPSFAGLMPRLEAASGAVIEADRGAHHYRFVGVEIRPAEGSFLFNLVLLGSTETSAGQQPHHIIFDRCYLHGDPLRGTRRGIALNSQFTAVVDSYLSDFKEVGADSQAIGGWNGPGPFKIVNNYLEGAGENVMFGGAAPSIDQVVPSDIEIRRNHFFKPVSWKIGDASYQGTPWTIKNLFELKNARRVLIEGNLFENNWAAAQNGFGILLTVRTERDAAPWAVVEDVTFVSNIVRRTASGFNILGIDDSSPSRNGRTRFVRVANNLFTDVSAAGQGGSGTLFQILNGASGLTIEHNTALHDGPVISADLLPSSGLVFQNNIVEHNEYGVFGSGKGIGLPALDYYFPGYVFRRNVLVGLAGVRPYPSDNFYPASLAAVGFVDLGGGDYRLSGASAYRRAATDGADVGADFQALSAATGQGTAVMAPGAPDRQRRKRGAIEPRRGGDVRTGAESGAGADE